MYRKKKRTRSDADKEEIVGEAITRVMELLRVAGMHILDGLCIPQSGHKSSCEEESHVNEDYNIEDPPPEQDTIDLLTEPTKCSLLDGSGYDMDLALATDYPNRETCHTVPVEYGYAVVQPTYVWANARHINLPIQVGDEITTLDSAKTWPKRKFKDVVTVLNWAYSGHMDKKMKTKSKSKPKLVHKTDFPDYKVPTGWADQGALRMVQGLCEFILKEIVDPKGEFYNGLADSP
ncbi:hypothetical protein C2845_PM05G19040 [Panicum miliaceum]|uniref:DUF8039 domain-containing protein n=1 Tax=Panicum miliaceum TaxID=4540 RepID=A0A3L6T2X0_PANMI|nr:hypothetical protein C2845_PM05G19040 [Panicum miliaceum]